MMESSSLRRLSPLNRSSLLLFGIGASILYFLVERIIHANEPLTVILVICVILIFSVFSQTLINRVEESKLALIEANKNLELRILERTKALQASEAGYRTIFQGTGTAIVILNDDMTVQLANSQFANLAGIPVEELESGRSFLDFLEGGCRTRFLRGEFPIEPLDGEEDPATTLECRFVGAKGDFRETLITIAAIPEGGKTVVSLADITELKTAQRQVHRQAFHDALTGLPNRTLLLEHVNMALKRSHRFDDYYFSLLYLDIDRFKNVNDSMGHQVGDKLLIKFSERVKKCLREMDIISRLGGDEFVILLDDIESAAFATTVADRLLRELKKPFHIEGHEIFAPASFGIVLDTKKYHQPEDLMRDADAAMYFAKEQGRAQYKVYDKSLHEKALQFLKRETDLRKAVDNREFDLSFQPIILQAEETIAGFEALIRWRHPQLGLVLPGSFIPVAEETGLIIPIGRWVLGESCRRFQAWRSRLSTPPPLFMTVNISGRHFSRPQLEDDVRLVLSETGLPAEALKIEITETALMDDTEEAIRRMQRLKDMGVRMVIDDFGTGYSSLGYLQRLPIDTLKIDKGFVSRMVDTHDPESNRGIVEAIISLSARLKINVVAEGVETPEQLAVLRELGCPMIQGYYFSKPLPPTAMERLLQRAEDLFLASQGASIPASLLRRIEEEG